MEKLGKFRLEQVALDKEGTMSIIGKVGFTSLFSRMLRPKYEMGIRRRDEHSCCWFQVEITDAAAGQFSVKATVDATGGDDPAEYADIYFRRVGETEKEAQRVHFPSGFGAWNAYPTKFGNMSFKRGKE